MKNRQPLSSSKLGCSGRTSAPCRAPFGAQKHEYSIGNLGPVSLNPVRGSSHTIPRLFYRNAPLVKRLMWKLVSEADWNAMRCFFGLISAFTRTHVARYIRSSRLELSAKLTPPFQQISHSNGISHHLPWISSLREKRR